MGNREGQGGRGGRGSLPPGIAVEPPTAPFPPDPNSPPLATFFELGANIPGGLPYTPWAADLKKQRMATDDKDNPDANCMPMGFTQFHMQPQPRKIIQTPKLIVILYEANYGLRYIYTDGRKLPPQGEPQPWWYGYSVGRWEGDTLVVETNNLRGAEEGRVRRVARRATAVRTAARRSSPSASAVPIFGKLEIDVTVEDAKAYTKPFTVRINQRVTVDEEPIEFVCNENQQFRRKIKIDSISACLKASRSGLVIFLLRVRRPETRRGCLSSAYFLDEEWCSGSGVPGRTELLVMYSIDRRMFVETERTAW